MCELRIPVNFGHSYAGMKICKNTVILLDCRGGLLTFGIPKIGATHCFLFVLKGEKDPSHDIWINLFPTAMSVPSLLRGPKAWLQCSYHVFRPDSWLLFDMNIQVILQRIYFIYQPHPSTCSLTTPRPHPLLLHRRGRVLPSIPEHPR